MNEINLSNDDRAALLALLDARHPTGVFRNRAEILLAYDDGLPTAEIARKLNISPRLARYWKQTFHEKGMAIFSDAMMSLSPETDAVSTPEADEPAQTTAEEAAPSAPKKPKTPKKPGILPDDDTSVAGVKLFSYLFEQMLANEEGTRRGEDIEALHDMRVATRRLRAAFEVFSPYFPAKTVKPFRRGIRNLGRALGNVRDLDVFLEKARAYLETPDAPPLHSVAPLLDYYGAQRENLRAALIEHLDSEENRQFVAAFQTFLEKTHQQPPTQRSSSLQQPRINQIAPILIYTRLADVRNFEQNLDNASLEHLHSLRTAFKYFRYTLEFFREVLGDEVRQSIEELKRIQDHLGDLNDANVACGLINAFLSAFDQRQDTLPLSERENPEGVIAYLGARSRERHNLLREFPQAWMQFDRPEFRQLIAASVSAL